MYEADLNPKKLWRLKTKLLAPKKIRRIRQSAYAVATGRLKTYLLTLISSFSRYFSHVTEFELLLYSSLKVGIKLSLSLALSVEPPTVATLVIFFNEPKSI